MLGACSDGRRIYLDWRLFLIYPVVVLLPSSFLYSFATGPRSLAVWQDLLVSFLVLTTTLLMWRVAGEGIYTNDQGVRIQHLIRRRELDWTDVVRVYDARPAGVIAFRTANGQTILSPVQWMGAVDGKSIEPMLRRAAYDRLIERLNEQHAKATQTAATKGVHDAPPDRRGAGPGGKGCRGAVHRCTAVG
jgi:hypothetical protein